MENIKECFFVSKNSLFSGYYLVAINYMDMDQEFIAEVRLFNIHNRKLNKSGVNVNLNKNNLNFLTDNIEDFAIKQFQKIAENLIYESKYALYSKNQDDRILNEGYDISIIDFKEFVANLWLLPDQEKTVIKSTFQNSSFTKETKDRINIIDLIKIQQEKK